MLIVRGNNVFPSNIEAIVREFPEIVEFRIVVSRQREMQHVKLEVEPFTNLDTDTILDLLDGLVGAIKERLQFLVEVIPVPTSSLPRFEMKAKRLVRV